MKVSVNDKELFTISETQKQVLKHFIPSAILDEDLERRLFWVIDHKYQNAFNQMKQEWDSKLVANGVKSVPTNKDEYAQLVFAQPNYKDRDAVDAESELNMKI